MDKTIVIEPGHGLSKEGKYSRPLIDCRGENIKIIPNSIEPNENDYKYGFYREDFGTLSLANGVRKYLEELGHKVYLTREDNRSSDQYLSENCSNEWKKEYWKKWKWIVEYTNEKNADVFVSIHTNAGGGSGCSLFWNESPNGVELSESIAKELHNQIGLKIRRVAQHKYMVLRNNCHGRSVLLETLFHDNINEIKMLLDPNKENKIVKAIANGIDNYCKTF